jgi:phage terminase large subunit-like protein
LHASNYSTDEKLQEEFIVGSAHLFMGLPGRQMRDLAPQQLVVADVLNAGHRDNAILLPRRSAKTTSLIALALGRVASSRIDYRAVIVTATTAKAGISRFTNDVVPMLGRMPEGFRDRFKITAGNGREAVTWKRTNSSVRWAGTPADLRGEAFDLVIIDESGEPDAKKADDLRAAALPTLDTRPGAQLVWAGTAGRYRDGNALWSGLEVGRKGLGGIVEYAMPTDTTIDDIATWEQTEPLVRLAHPGINTLTTIEAVRNNYEQLSREQFLMEYGSVFGDEGGSTALIGPNQWVPLALPGEYPEPPKHFAIGIAVHPEPRQASASIVAVWRENGAARVVLLDHREGSAWVAQRVAELWARYRVPIVHDDRGTVLVVTEHLNRMRPRPNLEPQGTKHVTTAAALLVRDIHTGNLGHWDQPYMNAAILGMVRRQVSNGWALGRPNSDADITAAEAASLALRWYDEHPQRARIGIIAA